MEESGRQTQFAWQPLTPRGVAGFARCSVAQLLLVQFLFALCAAALVAWFVYSAWFPIITSAIARLPDQGEIRGGRLDWHGPSPQILAENRFLACAVDLPHAGEARSPAHLQLELGQSDAKFYSLLGFTRLGYMPGWRVACNRVELTPWWGAWAPPLLALLSAAVLAGLLLTWAILASAYLFPAWLVGFFANRDLTLGGSWRVCGAGLMPGALLMSAAILCYRFGVVELIGLGVAAAAHLVLGWGFILAAVLSLPRHPAAGEPAGNPFQKPTEDSGKGDCENGGPTENSKSNPAPKSE